MEAKLHLQQIDFDRILEIIAPAKFRVLGRSKGKIAYPAPIHEARDRNALTFCSGAHRDALRAVRGTKAGVVICPDDLLYKEADWKNKTLVLVDNPRLAFMRIVATLFAEAIPSSGVHPTAVVHPKAHLCEDIHIGPFTYLGKCEIGRGTIIYGHVHIYDNTRIGQNVVIHANSVLGADGFGYERNEQGELEKFPHLGGIAIGDNVEIGSNVSIDRGTLGDTVIGEGTKIDNLVHIAHNVIIGKHCAIIAHSMIGGSAKIGDYSWIAPCACLRDGIEVGLGATIGLAALVTKSVPDNSTVMGFPARPADEYKKILDALKQAAGIA